ncbi:MAG: hypothetical protein U0163_05040 [Gemmatimonadaceae bacterium]
MVTPGYFEAMKICATTVACSTIDGIDAPLAMVVNKRFVQSYWRARTDWRSRTCWRSPDSVRYTIVGVVDDVRANALTREVKPQFYITLGQFARAPGRTWRGVHEHGRMRPWMMIRARAIVPVRATARDLDPAVARVGDSHDGRGAQWLHCGPAIRHDHAGTSSPAALLLAAIGVFGAGVTDCGATRARIWHSRRTRRAPRRELVGLSLTTDFGRLASASRWAFWCPSPPVRCCVGCWWGVAATDPLTFVGVVTLTGAVGLPASAIPAYRAAMAQPAVLRSD